MAYSFTVAATFTEGDGLGGQRSLVVPASAVVPTEPAFCALGSATTTYAAIALGNIATPKSTTIVNDAAVELWVSTDGGATTAFTLGVTGSTVKQSWCSFGNAGTTPQVRSASSTAAYRTFILE